MGKYGTTELMKQESGQDGLKDNGSFALLMAAVCGCCSCHQGNTGGGMLTRGLASLAGASYRAADSTRGCSIPELGWIPATLLLWRAPGPGPQCWSPHHQSEACG